MTILIIANDKDLKAKFRKYFGHIGYSVIQYMNPLKAMDNLDEISPDVLVCNASDYPRHWKIVVKQIRENRNRNDVVAILLIANDFDSSEANKAVTLGVNILFSNIIETIEDFENLNNKISRYKSPPGLSKKSSWFPQEENPVLFAFSHPKDLRMIAGHCVELSSAGGVFRPNEPGEIADLETGTVIESCSMKMDSLLISLQARVTDNLGTLSIEFIEFKDNGFENFLNEMRKHVEIVDSSKVPQGLST